MLTLKHISEMTDRETRTTTMEVNKMRAESPNGGGGTDASLEHKQEPCGEFKRVRLCQFLPNDGRPPSPAMRKVASSLNDGHIESSVVIYVTKGVRNGDSWRRSLVTKFLAAVEPGPGTEICLPRWLDLPFPTEITCAVSDDIDEERTQKLIRQGVLVVQSSWILTCIAERRLLLPINEGRFGLKPNTCFGESKTNPGIVHLRKSSPDFVWKSHHDDLLFAIMRARNSGSIEETKDLEAVLAARIRCPMQEIEKRILVVCSQRMNRGIHSSTKRSEIASSGNSNTGSFFDDV